MHWTEKKNLSRQYLASIKISVLGSEMGKVTAQFGSNAGSMDALKAKSEVYNKQIDEQKKEDRNIETGIG